jgi:hypothetical protein
VARKVIQDELAPVVREAITEDVMQAVKKLVGLTPAVVNAIEADLSSDDAAIRQRAYTLVAKYTMGKDSLAAPKEGDDQRQLNVQFNIPRPDTEDEPIKVESYTLNYDETRTCDQCGEDKPINDFVSGSDRCAKCHQANSNKAQDLLEKLAGRGR